MDGEKNPFVFPTGLNLLDKDTKTIVSKISRTRELTDGAQPVTKQTPLSSLLGGKKRIIFQSNSATLVPNTKAKLNFEKQKSESSPFALGQTRKIEEKGGRLVGHVKNYESNRQQELRDEKIRDILKDQKKRRKEEKKARSDKSKSSERPTAILIRGLREKTFKKNYIRRHLQKFGEILRISSVVGQARSVMVRFAEPSSTKKVMKIANKDMTEIFPRFPKAEIKLVKSSKSKTEGARAFQPVTTAHPSATFL